MKASRLLALRIRREQDVVLARQRARQIAAALGYSLSAQTQISTAVSEIARNAFQYARGGMIEFSICTESLPTDSRRTRQVFVIDVKDMGEGIPALESILAGSYRSQGGMGLGIIGSGRLMDRLDIVTTAEGTKVHLAKLLPNPTVLRTAAQISELMATLAHEQPAGSMEELEHQNRELLRAMEEASLREEELERVNQELAQTNAGVLALYDELETLNRISALLATKMELRPLIQSIVDVTTDLTNAELGVFLFRSDSAHAWHLYATSGACKESVAQPLGSSVSTTGDLAFPEKGVLHVADATNATAGSGDAGVLALVQSVSPGMLIGSFLVVPVLENAESLSGILFLVSSQPKTFTERSERIILSVTNQAAIGIQKARLFQSLESTNIAKDQFFAALSHELRTPLNPAVLTVSGLLSDPNLPESIRNELEVVFRNLKLEVRLIDDLLDFNRLINGKMSIQFAEVDLHSLIESVVGICDSDFTAGQLSLTKDYRATESTVSGESARLQQVLWNILKNSIKFTPPHGTISITTENVGASIRIQVIDTGRGIDPEHLERIFKPFNQLEPSTNTSAGGLGLGLTIARKFIDLHKGRITADSQGLGRGTRFVIELPVTLATAGASVLGKSSGPSSAIGLPSGARILLVDDHADTLTVISRILRGRGFEVTSATCASEAMAAAREHQFDLLISDLGLPGLAGHELLTELRTLQALPAIAVSGYGMDSDIAKSRAAGFQYHLIKPIDFQLLWETIHSVISETPKPSSKQ